MASLLANPDQSRYPMMPPRTQRESEGRGGFTRPPERKMVGVGSDWGQEGEGKRQRAAAAAGPSAPPPRRGLPSLASTLAPLLDLYPLYRLAFWLSSMVRSVPPCIGRFSRLKGAEPLSCLQSSKTDDQWRREYRMRSVPRRSIKCWTWLANGQDDWMLFFWTNKAKLNAKKFRLVATQSTSPSFLKFHISKKTSRHYHCNANTTTSYINLMLLISHCVFHDI
jgi:hypothetical protein